MKDQQIDALALYKAYYRFLQEEQIGRAHV